MPLKIAHLTSVHQPFDTRIFHKECKTLCQQGYEVVLIVPHYQDQEVEGVRIKAVTKTQSRLKRMLFTVMRVYRQALAEKADLYHFHDPELIPVGLLLRLRGKRVIYDVHEDVPRQILSKHWIKKPVRRAVSALFERFENFAAKRFNGVVAATPFIQERFLRVNRRTINVNNYPILEEFEDISSWTDKERAVSYVGGITVVRGIMEMVEAIGMTNAKLLLAGNFSPVILRELAVTKEGWRHVEELGHLNRSGVVETLQRSVAGLVVLHPIVNYLDSLPIKMFEYMSAGLPVIASDFPLWRGIMEQHQCGICVDPMNSREIADAIQWLLEHPERAREMGENGRLAVRSLYNWRPEGRKLTDLYEMLN